MQSKYHCKNRRKYNLKVHIVIVTKYRKKLLTGGLDLFLKKACAYIAKQRSWEIVAMETDKDHIHILLEYDTTECVCNIVSIPNSTILAPNNFLVSAFAGTHTR